jgi:hypothetical protein
MSIISSPILLSLEKFWRSCLPFSWRLWSLFSSIGLISGAFLTYTVCLSFGLVLLFNIAIIVNLLRGYTRLSCHCGGVLGDHQISWWLVGRNSLISLCLIWLLFLPPDMLTFFTLIQDPEAFVRSGWIVTSLPVSLIAIGSLLLLRLAKNIRMLFAQH